MAGDGIELKDDQTLGCKSTRTGLSMIAFIYIEKAIDKPNLSLNG
jgi:hypothetical protein